MMELISDSGVPLNCLVQVCLTIALVWQLFHEEIKEKHTFVRRFSLYFYLYLFPQLI